MRKPLFIYGAGGLGREVLSMVNASDEWETCGFIDDGVPAGTVVNGLKVLGGSAVIASFQTPFWLVFALGNPLAKAMAVQRITNMHAKFPVIIHPNAILQDVASIRIGPGTIVAAGAILTTDIDIGKHVLINLNATIGHDVSVGNFCSVMPGANIAGEVIIGESVLVGAGANVMNQITIGNRSTVGMGAVVIRNVTDDVTVVGVPANPIGR